jgi:hypothetical protein
MDVVTAEEGQTGDVRGTPTIGKRLLEKEKAQTPQTIPLQKIRSSAVLLRFQLMAMFLLKKSNPLNGKNLNRILHQYG